MDRDEVLVWSQHFNTILAGYAEVLAEHPIELVDRVQANYVSLVTSFTPSDLSILLAIAMDRLVMRGRESEAS